jgi:hypothetical protein
MLLRKRSGPLAKVADLGQGVPIQRFFLGMLLLLPVVALMLLFCVIPARGESIPTSSALAAADELIHMLRSPTHTVAVDCPDLTGAAIQEVFAVHAADSGQPIYGLVPVRAGGEIVGVIGVDASGERWLWISFGYRHESFPRVSMAQARSQVAERALALRQAEPAHEGQLVLGFDKHIYWSFPSEDGARWFVHMDRSEIVILTSLDGSARKALEPPEGLLEKRSESPAPAPQRLDPDRFKDDDPPPAYNIPGFPYHYQIEDWYCGPSSLQMVMNYYGEEIDQVTISDVADDVPGSGCGRDNMRRSAHFSGMSAAIQDPTMQGYPERQLGYAAMVNAWVSTPYLRIKKLLSANYPLFVLSWWDPGHNAGHYRVLKGYDDNLGVYVIHDPWYTAPFWGPDLLMNQQFFMDDQWVYSNRWGMLVSPWILTPEAPARVAEGDTFAVELKVYYPGPRPFDGDFDCSGCAATINLPGGLMLAGRNASQALPNLASGDSATVTWDLIASGIEGTHGIAFQAQGIVEAFAPSYGTYTDSIGGYGYETITVARSRDAGWPEEIRLSEAAGSAETCLPGGRSMAVEDDGTVHVVWADTRDGNSEIYYCSRVEGTWGFETRLTNDTCFSDCPAIACAEDGRVHVAWVDSRDGNLEIYYKEKDAGGWSADERVTVFDRVDHHPSLAVGPEGVCLAWERHILQVPQVWEVYFSTRSDGGWSTPSDPDGSDLRDSYRPSVAWGQDGLVHLVYERQSATDEMEKIRYRSWDGMSWSSATVLSSDSSYSRTPAIAAGRDSTLHVVWQDGENVGGNIFYATYDGSAWQATEHLDTGASKVGTPGVSVDGSGTVHVVWADHRHGYPQIYLMSDDGSGWSDEIRISQGRGSSMLPNVAANGSSEVCVVWTDLRHGAAEVYFRTNTGMTGVEEDLFVVASGHVDLSRPHPTPFTSSTRLNYALSHSADLLLEVFDVQGRRVRTLAGGLHAAGSYFAVWDGRNASGVAVAPGVYFVRCATSRGNEVERVVLVR